MSILTALTGTGRTYDVLALRGQVPTGTVLLAQDLYAGGGQVATGMVKLAQWFVIQLCEVQGSKPFDLLDGTAFFAKLTSGRLRTETDLFVAFSLAVGEILALARQIETDSVPDDERLAGATLDAVTLTPALARLHITLTSRAGDARPVILPIPTTTF